MKLTINKIIKILKVILLQNINLNSRHYMRAKKIFKLNFDQYMP